MTLYNGIERALGSLITRRDTVGIVVGVVVVIRVVSLPALVPVAATGIVGALPLVMSLLDAS